MPSETASNGLKKRKQPSALSPQQDQPKKLRPSAAQPQKAALIGPHESIVAELQSKYDIVVASVISSTQIRKRVVQATAHLLASPSDKPHLMLLHARTAEVCKLITIVEHCKRTLGDQGQAWYQHNQLFDLPADQRKEKGEVIEDTVLDKDDDSDTDDFEVMGSRFEKAVQPAPSGRVEKSLRVFLATQPVPELRTRSDVTVQTGEEPKS